MGQRYSSRCAVATVGTLSQSRIGIPWSGCWKGRDFWGKGGADALIFLPVVLHSGSHGYCHEVKLGIEIGLVGAWLADNLGIRCGIRWTGEALAARDVVSSW